MEKEAMYKLAEEYASVAVQLLEQQGQPYGDEDIIKVSEFLIDQDYKQEIEKRAEEARVSAFYSELEKQAAGMGGVLPWIDDVMRSGALKILPTKVPTGPVSNNMNKARNWLANSIWDNPRKWAAGIGGAGVVGTGLAGKAIFGRRSTDQPTY